MSHDAGCESPVERPSAREEIHWAEHSTPLLGRRGKRNASPDNSDGNDEEDTLAILPPAFKRIKTSSRPVPLKAFTKKAKSEMRLSYSAKTPSTELPDAQDDNISVTASYYQVKTLCNVVDIGSKFKSASNAMNFSTPA